MGDPSGEYAAQAKGWRSWPTPRRNVRIRAWLLQWIENDAPFDPKRRKEFIAHALVFVSVYVVPDGMSDQPW